MTDHGGDNEFGRSNKPFRGEKATLFEGGIRVPCLMRWPGRIKAGSTSDEILSALDLFPTLCALAKVDVAGQQLDGEDITDIEQACRRPCRRGSCSGTRARMRS